MCIRDSLFILNIADATTVQLTKEANLAQYIGVGGAAVSKDGSMLAYTVSDTSKNRALVVPNYLDEFTAAGSVRRGWAEQKSSWPAFVGFASIIAESGACHLSSVSSATGMICSSLLPA